MPGYSKDAQAFISHKMSKMKGEDKPQAQKVAIAMSMARQRGLKVPGEKHEAGQRELATSRKK